MDQYKPYRRGGFIRYHSVYDKQDAGPDRYKIMADDDVVHPKYDRSDLLTRPDIIPKTDTYTPWSKSIRETEEHILGERSRLSRGSKAKSSVLSNSRGSKVQFSDVKVPQKPIDYAPRLSDMWRVHSSLVSPGGLWSSRDRISRMSHEEPHWNNDDTYVDSAPNVSDEHEHEYDIDIHDDSADNCKTGCSLCCSVKGGSARNIYSELLRKCRVEVDSDDNGVTEIGGEDCDDSAAAMMHEILTHKPDTIDEDHHDDVVIGAYDVDDDVKHTQHTDIPYEYASEDQSYQHVDYEHDQIHDYEDEHVDDSTSTFDPKIVLDPGAGNPFSFLKAQLQTIT